MKLKTSIINPSSGTGFLMKKGALLKITDPSGQQVSDLYSADTLNVADGFSAGRTIDYNDTLFLTTGHTLYSHSGQKHLEIIEDTCGRHDVLVTPCSLQMFHMMSGTTTYHASCHENLTLALKSFGIDPLQLTSTFNVFMNVTVDPKGKIKVEAPTSKAGDYVVFQAYRDLIIGLTACSDEGTNNGSCKQIFYELFLNGC